MPRPVALTDLEPPHVEEELEQSEDGHVEIDVVTRVTLSRVEELLPEDTAQEEGVDGQRRHLATRRTQ